MFNFETQNLTRTIVYETNESNDDQLAKVEDPECKDTTEPKVPSEAQAVKFKSQHKDILVSDSAYGSGSPEESPSATALAPNLAVSVTAIAAPPSATESVLVTPVRRTASQIIRESAFGASDDELSEVEDPPSPPQSKRKIASKPCLPTVQSAKGVNGRKVPDLADEFSVSTPSKPQVLKVQKKAVDVTDDEIEDVITSSKTLVYRRRSVLAMAPVSLVQTSSARPHTTVSRSATLKKDLASGSGNRSTRLTAKDLVSSRCSPICIDLDDDDDPHLVLPRKSMPASPEAARRTGTLQDEHQELAVVESKVRVGGERSGTIEWCDCARVPVSNYL